MQWYWGIFVSGAASVMDRHNVAYHQVDLFVPATCHYLKKITFNIKGTTKKKVITLITWSQTSCLYFEDKSNKIYSGALPRSPRPESNYKRTRTWELNVANLCLKVMGCRGRFLWFIVFSSTAYVILNMIS